MVAFEQTPHTPITGGDKISLLATPDEHWVFFRWTGVGSEYLENKLSPSTYPNYAK